MHCVKRGFFEKNSPKPVLEAHPYLINTVAGTIATRTKNSHACCGGNNAIGTADTVGYEDAEADGSTGLGVSSVHGGFGVCSGVGDCIENGDWFSAR